MKFYSDMECDLLIHNGTKDGIRFVGGVYETDNKADIELIEKCGYRREEDGFKQD